FEWKGDHNYWPGYHTFLKIVDVRSPAEAIQRPFNSGDVVLPATTGMWKQSLPIDRPLHAIATADLVLRDASPGDMARFGASDGRVAGAEIDDLPQLPSAPVANSIDFERDASSLFLPEGEESFVPGSFDLEPSSGLGPQ